MLDKTLVIWMGEIGRTPKINPQTGRDQLMQEFNVQLEGHWLKRDKNNNKIAKNLQYFVEYDTDPAFPQPQVEHLVAARQRSVTLPGKDDEGNPQPFYFRAYSQYQGGHPGEKVHFGGDAPIPVDPGGPHQMTLNPSTGSGTAQNNGQEGGSGFGKIQIRPATAKKRTI
jgi:hypothetical protein